MILLQFSLFNKNSDKKNIALNLGIKVNKISGTLRYMTFISLNVK